MGVKADNKAIQLKNKQTIVDLQKFYVSATLDNLDLVVENKKEEIIDKLLEYKEKFTKPIFDKNGYEIGKTLELKPYLVSSYFFKSINPLGNIEPEYSPEKLAIVFDLYMYLIEQVNAEIGDFAPTKTHFCKFAGITTSTLNKYKNSPVLEMRTIVEKIYDECFDSSLTMAQKGRLNERTTIFRAKSELEVVEKPQAHVNITANVVDLGDINDRLAQLKMFNSKKQ